MITRYQVQGTQSEHPLDLEIGLTTVYVRWDIKRVENDEFEGWVYNETQYSKDEYIALLADKQQVNQIETKLLNADERYQLLDKSDISLEDLKQFKLEQLSYLCTQTILGRFSCIIDEVEYEFSYDMEAQSRFTGIAVLFVTNKITEIEWTAYENGERVRIILNQANFDIVSQSALHHQNSNIIRYNELLQDVMNATTIEDIDNIVW